MTSEVWPTNRTELQKSVRSPVRRQRPSMRLMMHWPNVHVVGRETCDERIDVMLIHRLDQAIDHTKCHCLLQCRSSELARNPAHKCNLGSRNLWSMRQHPFPSGDPVPDL